MAGTKRETDEGRGCGSAPFPSMREAALVIAILWLVTLFSQLDRQIPALLAQPIKAAFAISDTQFSFLQGYAFALTYTILGVPLGRLVDRTHRRNLILAGLLFWSLMTMLAGLATSYEQLLLARMGVGIGEAVLAPAAYSIIADYVPPDRRGRALAVYYVSLAIGSGASLFLGGLILSLIPPEGLVIGGASFQPWQLAFLAAGAPGLPLALLLLAVKEPVRREQAGLSHASIRDFLRYVGVHRATFARLLTYPAVLAVIGYGVLAWAPALFQRSFQMPPARSGLILGALVALAGLAGTVLSGFLSDRWRARKVPAARFRVTLAAWLIIIPAAALWPLMPSLVLAFALLALAVAGFALGQAAAPASIQEVLPNAMRGQAIALYLLLGGLLGIGFGPTSVALMTDYVFGNEAMLPYALVAVSVPASLIGLYLCWSGQAPYARTLAKFQLSADNPTTAPIGRP